MIRSLLFWNIFPLAPILLKTLIACQQRKIKNQSTTSERFNMCHIERVSTAYSHVIASPANCTISPSVWNVFLWNISQMGAEVLFNTLICSVCIPECFPVSRVPFPASSLLCPWRVGEKDEATRTRGTLLPLGRGIKEGNKDSKFKGEIKTKLNLLSTHPLKAGGVLCLLNPPRYWSISLFSWCCRDLLLPTNSSTWHLLSCPGLPSLAGHNLLSPQSQKELPSVCPLWISSPKRVKLPHFLREGAGTPCPWLE